MRVRGGGRDFVMESRIEVSMEKVVAKMEEEEARKERLRVEGPAS